MKRKYYLSDYVDIKRVFTDDTVNQWSVDFLNGFAKDYKSYDVLPNLYKSYVKECIKQGKTQTDKHGTTSYSLINCYFWY